MEIKYCRQDFCLQQCQYDTTTSLCHFLTISFRFLSKYIEQKGNFLQAQLVYCGKMDKIKIDDIGECLSSHGK